MLFLVLSFISNCQKSNTIYLEIGGRSFYGALTYDKLIKRVGNSNLGFSVGFMAIPTYFLQSWAVPTSFNFITGADKSYHLELGIGLTYHLMRQLQESSSKENSFENKHLLYLNSTIGYRYQRKDGGLFLKANLNIMSGIYGQVDIDGNTTISEYYSGWFKSTWLHQRPVMAWGGIGVGYTF